MERRRVWLERWGRDGDGEEEMGREGLRDWSWRRMSGVRRMARKTKEVHFGMLDGNSCDEELGFMVG